MNSPEPDEDRFYGVRCLKSYARSDSFKRHIIENGERKGNCHEECTPMFTSEYEALCKKTGYQPVKYRPRGK